MRPWTRGEKIGFWSMLIGGITCLAVLSTAPPFRQWLWGSSDAPSPATTAVEQVDLGLYQEAFEQQKKLFEEQTLHMQEEIRRLHDERIAARKARISTISERYEKDGKRKYDKILFENLCKIPIWVALHYKDLDDTWISRGWWKVQPGKTVTTDAMTRNTPIYIYAENTSAKRTWDGTGKQGSVSYTISNARFDHIKGERFVFDKPREASFFRRETGKAWTDHKETFECLLEARP